MGEIRVGLYGQVAPKSVAHFVELARDDVYDGTLFHRVIPEFMIQGGDPKSTNEDRRRHGSGGTGFRVEDEYSNARHDRGVVSFANRGRPGSAGSQFFIVHQDSHDLDGKYSAFGRVLEGMEVVDAITEMEIDTYGRWGPKNHPIEKAMVSGVRIEGAGSEVAMGE
ncbi:MAG: peptidylprolyl isomerase [Deltaproteobacteria bacterium]|nr:peptidylprolyl isomerase [Deltaproteobacteria bacterium]MBW2416994.1 peptidylprolyl isomerase [Deltaproteobacteria bacterium]